MFTSDYNILFAFLTSLLATYFIIPKVIKISKKFRLTDTPGERSSHEGSIPLLGGLAIFFGFIFSILLWSELQNIQFLLVSIMIIFFTGIVDDLVGLSPYKKIFFQIIAILNIIYFGDIQINNMHKVLGVEELPDFMAIIFTIFVVIVIINGFNLIDGVDGLAGGLGTISAFCFGMVSLLMRDFDMAILAFSLIGSLLAFLRYNFHPAKIFMGDTGSLLVGMILSVLAIKLIQSGIVIGNANFPNKGPLLAIVFLAIPLFDSLRVFIVRSSKGHGPLSAGRDHIHHALLDLGFGHKRTSISLYLLSIFLILFSFFLCQFNINLGIAILALVAYVIFIIPFYFLRKKNKKMKK